MERCPGRHEDPSEGSLETAYPTEANNTEIQSDHDTELSAEHLDFVFSMLIPMLRGDTGP